MTVWEVPDEVVQRTERVFISALWMSGTSGSRGFGVDTKSRAEFEAIIYDCIANALRVLAEHYPSDVFPDDSRSRTGIAGAALRTVLSAHANLYQAMPEDRE